MRRLSYLCGTHQRPTYSASHCTKYPRPLSTTNLYSPPPDNNMDTLTCRDTRKWTCWRSRKLTISDRRTTVIMRRLRIGHTEYTQSYIMTSSNPPLCEHCNLPLNVNHILMDCPFLTTRRELCDLQGNMRADLTKPDFSANVVNFLNSLFIYYFFKCSLHLM